MPPKRRRTHAMELMQAALQQFANMESSDDLESEIAKLKEEVARKSEEIIELRYRDPRTRNLKSTSSTWLDYFKNRNFWSVDPY